MTKSFGSPGRQPQRPNRPSPEGGKKRPPEPPYRDDGQDQEDNESIQLNLPNWGPSRLQVSQGSTSAYAPPAAVKVDSSRRTVALFIDLVACYLVAMIITVLPFVSRLVPLPLVLALAFLGRDFIFEGRGVGKNLMGYQVVDSLTGVPASLIQSFKRNIILIMPFVAQGLITSLLNFAPIGWLNSLAMQIVNIAATAYVLIVLPMECYRAFLRPNSLRKGDEIAGTMIIEAPMDFSHFLPKQ